MTIIQYKYYNCYYTVMYINYDFKASRHFRIYFDDNRSCNIILWQEHIILHTNRYLLRFLELFIYIECRI